MRVVFKDKSRRIVYEVHQDDWTELEEGLVKSLEIHFQFWEEKLGAIQNMAKDAFKNFEKKHKNSEGNYKELMETLEKLLPYDQSEVNAKLASEKILLNFHE